jgi:hypothetical protein
MSELSRNQLVNRRDFFRRGAGKVAATGIGATLAKRAFGAPVKANPWAYDDSIFRRTDPKLLHYHETRRFPCARLNPRCLALSNDEHLFIGAGKIVTQCTLEGTQISEIKLTDEARCLAVADDGTLYVGFKERVQVYDSKGHAGVTSDVPTGKPYFTGLAASKDSLFVADAGNRIVLRYDRSGKLAGRIGAKDKDKNIPGFIVPSPFFDVEVAADGLLRVTNPGRHRVEIYTKDGDLEGFWGNPGAAIENFCGCCNPINLTLFADGRVITLEKGIPRVKVYSTEGAFESVVAGTEAFAENAAVCGPNDCTLGGLDAVADKNGRIYVLDLVAANVRVMEKKS